MELLDNIQINGFEDAMDILKSAGLEDIFEKAHNVGDLFFRDGKTYVYTEFSPGKFDWRIVKQKQHVIYGKGINGLHGIKALNKVYTSIDKTFTDPKKMMLKRTPNGSWRLHYDGNDAGMTIGGDTLTESELRKDDICYQDKRVVDNFEMLKDYMEFSSPDDER